MTKVQELTEQYHKGLPKRMREWLTNERGLTNEIVDKFKLGWDGKALTIPIYDTDGQYIFFKFRKDPQDSTSDIPKYWYTPDSSAELYGWEHIKNPPSQLVICEGELDRLILEANGIPAITATSGAGTFKEEWIETISSISSQIFICFDSDDAGLRGAGNIAKLMPDAKVVRIPFEGIKDVTDLITSEGIKTFRTLLDEAKTCKEIEEESRIITRRMQSMVFPPLSVPDLLDVLGMTIKEDDTNKTITFLCMLSAYTESSQFNISFNAPSSTGKSYLPIEISSLFPKEDVMTIGYCSPTAFFHEWGAYDSSKHAKIVDLSRKILIFLDQPHTLLLQHLRPLLSHDKKEISVKITDKKKGEGHRTLHIIIKGFPSVIFCTAGLKLDEQESTRFFLLSPETSQEKIRQAVYEKLRKETDYAAYAAELDSNPSRQALIARIVAIRSGQIQNINIGSPQAILKAFLDLKQALRPRHMRDVNRLISLVKAFALLNVWHREAIGATICTNNDDTSRALELWNRISESQELGLPPYVYHLWLDVILPACKANPTGATRQHIIKNHYETYGRSLPDWQLRRDILPMLETSGLIYQESDPEDKRRKLIYAQDSKNEIDSVVYPQRKEPAEDDTPSSLF